MTKRNPVSTTQNIWFDSEQVSAADLTLEQNYNQTIQSSIINNQIGTGILAENLLPRILFDSDLVTTLLDGVVVTPQLQPSDNNYGNQLEINLADSEVFGKRTVKIAVFGLDFQQNLQYETFVFEVNESQFTQKHYTSLLLILINDFSGPTNESFNLGGRITIKEADPYAISRDTISLSQNVQPNLFFRDFYSPTYSTITALLQAGLPYYNVDSLNITTTELDSKVIYPNDVTTQVGQKFLSNTNNIQKVTLLLSAVNPEPVSLTNDGFTWTGEIVVSIYPLQTAVQCQTDIVPNTLIEFPPLATPLAQISFNIDSLLANGVKLNSVPQPVDFVFSNTPVASGNSITPGNYYAVTIKRSGSPDKGEIYISAGSDLVSDSRVTVFNGSLWVDIPEQDLWFEIHSDAAKVTDGQAYDSGNGVLLPKTITDSNTGETIDYCLKNISFSGTQLYTATLFGDTEQNTPVQDLRTGNPVYSRQQIVPSVKLLSNVEKSSLQATTDPLFLGNIIDKNKKSFNSLDVDVASALHTFSFMGNELLLKVIDDPSDPRYDLSVIGLVTKLFSGELVDAKLYPNYINYPDGYYRIGSAEVETMLYGDVNGDGIVDETDYDLLNTYLGFDFNSVPNYTSTITTDTINTTFINGYITYKYPFIDATNLSFQIVDPNTNLVVSSGTDGYIVADPNNERQAVFGSIAVNFYSLGINNYTAVGGYKVVILNSAAPTNNGGFDILGLDNINNVLTIRKIVLNSRTIGELFRADITGDYNITSNDGYYLRNYIEKYSFTHPNLIYNKIGTKFNVLKFKLEKFLDRNDDYLSSSLANRNQTLHPLQDIYTEDGYVLNNPFSILIKKQFSWNDYLVVANTKNKLTSITFNNDSATVINNCSPVGIEVEPYQAKPNFDPGRVDSFVPANLIINQGGEIVRNDGNYYKVDFEVGTVVLEIPPGMYGLEKKINLFDDFISDYTGDGITRLGFPCMRFADCSTVGTDALVKNQLRISVTVQSFSPDTNGLSLDGYSGVIVDGKMGVYVDQETGLLSINFTNLYQDPVLRTLSTKLEIKVYLKKAGFNNRPLFVNSDKVYNLLGLIKTYLGTGEYPGDQGSPFASSIIAAGNSLSPLSGNAVPIYYPAINVTGASQTISASCAGVTVSIYTYDLNSATTTLIDSAIGSVTATVSLAIGQNGFYITTGDPGSFSAYQVILNRTS